MGCRVRGANVGCRVQIQDARIRCVEQIAPRGCKAEVWEAAADEDAQVWAGGNARSSSSPVFRDKFGIFLLTSVFWGLEIQQVCFLQTCFYFLSCPHQLHVSGTTGSEKLQHLPGETGCSPLGSRYMY